MGETDERPTQIDLFSGVGGFSLAGKWTGFRTVVFCERDEWCQKVLAKNFGAVVADAESKSKREQTKPQNTIPDCRKTRPKPFGGSPRIIPDIRDFDGTQWRGATLLTGGFPCQPFSCAGKRRGADDDRHLWPEMLRVIAEARPDWVIGENVAGFLSMVQWDRVPPVDGEGVGEGEIGDVFTRTGRGLADEAVANLESIGYTVLPLLIPACAVDARHRRDRVWIVANANGGGCRKDGRQDAGATGESPCTWQDEGEWFAQSGMGRVASGVPKRVDRLRGLGNSIVPQVAAELMRMIREIEMEGGH